MKGNMKTFIKKLLVRLSGGERIQRFLEKNVEFSQALMGIGSGTDVESSGEQALVQKLRRWRAKTGGTLCVFDVGANQGQFLRMMQVGLRDVPVVFHAFEPGKQTFEILADQTREYSNVRLNNFGLGRQTGEVELYFDRAGSGLASLSKRRLDHFGIKFELSEKIKILTLDDYCQRQQIDTIDLLKLDVEGHELDVLQGGAATFRAAKIKMLTFEFGGGNIDSRTYFQDFWYLLQEYGMRNIFRITPAGTLARVRAYRETCEQFRTTNYFVSRDEM